MSDMPSDRATNAQQSGSIRNLFHHGTNCWYSATRQCQSNESANSLRQLGSGRVLYIITSLLLKYTSLYSSGWLVQLEWWKEKRSPFLLQDLNHTLLAFKHYVMRHSNGYYGLWSFECKENYIVSYNCTILVQHCFHIHCIRRGSLRISF